MRKKILIYTLAVFIIIISINRCERKLIAIGDEADIHVLADSTTWLETESTIRDIFERFIVTPQDESIFTVERGDIQSFKRLQNLILVGTLDNDDTISSIIKSNLSPDALEKVKQGNYVFVKKEQWAKDQLIMFLISTDLDMLQQKLTMNRDYLFGIFDDHWNRIYEQRLYSTKEQTDIKSHLLKDYGMQIAVLHDYQLFIDKPQERFVMLRRTLPERWIFIHWIDTDDPSVISEDWYIAKRNELGQKFYEGDLIETKYVQPKFEEVDFDGRLALKVTGIWKNDIKTAGGPFISYCFYDENQRRIYVLDYAIFEPRLKVQKRDLLRQADIILRTFKIANQDT